MSPLAANLLILGIVAAIVIAIVLYLRRAKKRGQTCIGCPYAKQCGGGCSGDCDSRQNRV